MSSNSSHLSVDRYNVLSDTTMDSMLESLEVLLDDIANPEYEVEYHVRSPGSPNCVPKLSVSSRAVS